jgi:hypothetical protein
VIEPVWCERNFSVSNYWISALMFFANFPFQSKPSSARGKKGHDGEVNFEEDDTSTSDQQQNEKQLEYPYQQSDAHAFEYTVSASVLAESIFGLLFLFWGTAF